MKRLRGTRDFYPEEMMIRRRVFDKIRKVVERYGFREIDSPCIESFELFAKKSGEEIVNEIYAFEDKGGRFICLRPELTPSVARMIVTRQRELSKPIKWYSIPRLWRYERPQSGRLREFYQLNVDIFGSSSAKSDFEVLGVGIDVLLKLGLRNFSFNISNREFLQGLMEYYKVKDYLDVFKIIDKRAKFSEEDFLKELEKFNLKASELLEILDFSGKLENLFDLDGFCKNKNMEKALENLKEIYKYLSYYNFDKYCKLDLSIVRGLDYYTGMVFEVYDREKKMRALFGGGRYDNLIESFGGKRMPAVGFGMGDAVLELMMKREEVWPREEIETDYFVCGTGNVDETVLKIVKNLRKKFVVDFDLLERSLSAQMRYADKINARKVVIVGEKDLAEEKVTVRDMESGEEEKVFLKEILSSNTPQS